jgi:oligopeptide transport system ATP-binding protein
MHESPADSIPLLRVVDLKKHFPIRKGFLGQRVAGLVRAVDGVSFEIPRGETLGLVGESGCGKSTTGRCVLRLIEPTDGEIHLCDAKIHELKGGALRELRREMQIIFQDPHGSLNPRMRIGDIIREPLDIFRVGTARDRATRARDLLATVELPKDAYSRFPHEFSGGQRQRIGIARALALSPKLIVCDEPVSALDVSIQAQVMNLLRRLQDELGLTYLFIAHDLAVVRHISNRVAVMYLGKIVEIADAADIYDKPAHPYTLALLSANPVPDPSVRLKHVPLTGEVPSAAHVPGGCRFHPRCPFAEPICREIEPDLEPVGDGAHLCACHLRGKVQVSRS